MSDALDILGRLRKKAREDLARVQDRMAKGLGRKEYHQMVGQAKILQGILDQIQSEVRELNGGGDADG